MRPFLQAILAGLTMVSATFGGDLRNFDDAALHKVQFVDEKEGWAVGDEGVVWHTVNGGADWERQSTGVRASLCDLHFLNPYTGWIAGREELPNGRGSAGVILHTTDGGLRWTRHGLNALPGLNAIRFVDGQIGFALGDGTDQFPTGIFRTQDVGRSWQPVSGPRAASWLAADFQDARTGVLAGAWSRLAIIREGSLHRADVEENMGPRAIRGLQVVGTRAIAVGQGGLVLISHDTAGGSWGYASNLRLPVEIRSSWDFHAVHCLGEEAWVAGRPGSVILHSPDLGDTWEVFQTGQPLPLNGVYFASARRGWAVGEFGEILGTEDGGRSWRVQRRGGQRAALLFVHARPGSIPLPTIAIEGGQEGYLATALRVLSPDPTAAAPAEASAQARLNAATRQTGGAAAEMMWQFPVPEHLERGNEKALMQSWHVLHGDHAPELLLRQLVLALRTWRPSVVVTDVPEAQVTGYSCDGLVAETVQEAFTRAADPHAFPEQIERLGLKPWEALKLYCLWERQSGAEVVQDLNQAQTRLEATARAFAAGPAEILLGRPEPRPALACFHLEESRLAGAARHRQLMQGAELAPGGVQRRQLPVVAELSPQVEKAIRDRRNLEMLAEIPSNGLADPGRLLAEVGPMLTALPDHQAAEAAFAVANQYARLGEWNMAREVFLLMTNRYPNQPLCGDAYRWLIRHNTSGEARRRQELGQFRVESHAAAGPVKPSQSEGNVKIQGMPASRQIVARADLLGTRAEARRWYEGSLDFGARLTTMGSIYANDPAIQFCLQSARRRLGEVEKANDWYTRFHAEQPEGPWRDAAGAELWIFHRVGNPPKKVVYTVLTPTRPFLDGEFEEACWQNQQPLKMQNAAGDTLKDYPTEARLSYDKDFLYLALTCRHPLDRHVPPAKVRGQDANVRDYDHVSLLLDVDRDYSTYFRLEVDQRGCVSDDCWGDKSWNPHWFVAVKSEPGCWRIEAAIPMTELTGDSVTIGRTWACNLVRTIPGKGVQAWSVPAAADPPRPEGMGLLMFMGERDHDKPMAKLP
jgi:photosystem II stability/assembly factor-like uncharacterized protein